ncbi:MAG: DNA starvation/stationary phase protection protein [Rickettsiales bacterium]|nr:DNA starvation/stationary phase protection protein [Pseudomonadota bacterium]MDA0966985.1 DNA starvation/stationary phase protection protein [Pseudomonadota bacterium]MDG4543905.1 DNA starvation/stationary phase protection protein [Rickettsiales bacterium]MDG4546051.1 DNA starvation/stationary phase protection protein [Rickettsiales bacterium]MDG4548297.1 DNA starvation/stationary phase protection protein [Rickettsiales bacterium]
MSNSPVAKLKIVLADSYTLYLKTQNFHWNVTGSNFRSLHTLFEAQYNDLFAANDDIAERIRTLGEFAPGSFRQFSSLTNISEAPDSPPSAQNMVKELASDQKKIIDSLNVALKEAQNQNDEATADLMIGRIATHEKNKWMLESSL